MKIIVISHQEERHINYLFDYLRNVKSKIIRNYYYLYFIDITIEKYMNKISEINGVNDFNYENKIKLKEKVFNEVLRDVEKKVDWLLKRQNGTYPSDTYDMLEEISLKKKYG